MATLHMNVENCQTTASAMDAAKTALDQQVSDLNGKVSGTVGSEWIAPSATEFQNSFNEWAVKMKQISEELAVLKQRLTAEINEFEQVASRLA